MEINQYDAKKSRQIGKSGDAAHSAHEFSMQCRTHRGHQRFNRQRFLPKSTFLLETRHLLKLLNHILYQVLNLPR